MNRSLRNTTLIAGYLILACILFSCAEAPLYKDTSKSVEVRVNDLIARMTLDEKLLLLSGDTTGFDTHEIKRLGIPAIHVTDGPLGVRNGKATAFPAGVAMAASWDTALIHDVAVAMGQETKAKGRNYLLGPCVCIQRFPYGGRNFETYSEDPYLASRLAVNWVKGVQSENILTSVKHFAMNDQEWERNRYNVIADERTMREIHLPAFEAAVREGGAWSVMAAYNLDNGQHCTENYHLLKDVLKGDWGFQGFVVSDWVSVYSTEHAANAGLDLEMPIGDYFRPDKLKKAIGEKKVTEELINDKVRRILRAMFSVGMFENKPIIDTTVVYSEAHKQLALKSAQEAVVLLKNQNNILPIDNSRIKSIAVIGPNAKTCRTNGGGSSHVDQVYAISPLEGIQKRAGNIKISYAVGDNFNVPEKNVIKPTYLLTPDKKENGLKAEYFNNVDLAGKPILTRIEKSLDYEWNSTSPAPEVHNNNFSIRFSGFIKPDKASECMLYTLSDDGIRVYLDDKLVINNWNNHGPLYDTYKLNLKAGKDQKIVIEYFQGGGGATFQLGWDYDRAIKKDFIAEAVEVAKTSDIAIIFAGLYDAIESEGNDPGTIELPSKQKELIEAVAKINSNTIVVLNGGIPLRVEPWLKDVKGLIDMFYLGQETGNAIASVLFGDVNPGGKLPFSFIKGNEQSPACKDYKNPNLQVNYSEGVFVGYRYLDKNKLEPLFSFGYGLSYTSFEYSNMKVNELGNKYVEVTVDVKNTGKVKGDEIVQLYVSDKVCSVPRPVKELKGFSRVALDAGQLKTIKLTLKPRDFAFWDIASNNWKVEPGDFDLLIGSSSRDIKFSKTINIK
jgi:beta-glucosidase